VITIAAFIKLVRYELVYEKRKTGTFTINPYDLFMLEMLMKLKKDSGCRIACITMGPMECMDAVRRIIAFGADEAFLVSDPRFSGSDTFATSHILTKSLKSINQTIDIIAFGEKSVDGETGQVPVGVAGLLGIQCITGVREICEVSKENILLKRQFNGRLEIMEAINPCGLVFKGFTTKEPTISLIRIKQTKGYDPIILDADTIGIDKGYYGQEGSKTVVKNAVNTISKRDVIFLEGTLDAKAEAFRRLLSGNKHIIESSKEGGGYD